MIEIATHSADGLLLWQDDKDRLTVVPRETLLHESRRPHQDTSRPDMTNYLLASLALEVATLQQAVVEILTMVAHDSFRLRGLET